MDMSVGNSKATLRLSLMLALLPVLALASGVFAQARVGNSLALEIDRLAAEAEERVITWRRDLHQHPELSNQEFRTAQVVADHLRRLGLEVQTEVAHTGVVGILRGTKATPVVALRADMDALPVTEAVDLPFASKAKAVYNGKEVGVMHACGHDAHTSILMGVAEVLSAIRSELPGTVKFIFQPAEEGAPRGEAGGARLMVAEGVLEAPKPDAIFGLHVSPSHRVGTLAYRSGPLMASSDGLRIIVRGRQTHAAAPWAGTDPIVTAAQIVLGLQTIISRQVDLTAAPAIVSIGSIHGGVRGNIIPDEVEMVGTVRAFDPETQEDIHQRIRNTATMLARSTGATAEVTINRGYPVTVNDAALTERMTPTFKAVVGKDNVVTMPPMTGAEDFSYYLQQVPGVFFFLGVTPKEADPNTAPMLHSPRFSLDEGALLVGVRALSHLAVAYMEDSQK
jgi:amidohydrolase